jgi:hypothetical protein
MVNFCRKNFQFPNFCIIFTYNLKTNNMKTVFPEKPARDFNEWIGYIKSEIDKSNGKGRG